MHDDEIPIEWPLVRALVDRDRPDFADLPLVRLEATGSTNALFRLGSDLLVRLPRQPGGSQTIEKEQRWLPYVASALPVAVPEIVAVGDPGFGYPERWSVVRWLTGEKPLVIGSGVSAEDDRGALARDLADVVWRLGGLDVPDDARRDPTLRWYRGEPLVRFDSAMRRAITDCRTIPDLAVDLDAVVELWENAVAQPGSARVVEPRWLHGDLAAENLLVRAGRLAAVLDFGGLSVGDPTIDLAVAWEVLDAPARAEFRAVLRIDDDTWLRGRAWALALAVMTFPYYHRTMPARCADRLAAARAVLADH
jgi:aminoglycoside phosphotransferase (APT) family kinase protein